MSEGLTWQDMKDVFDFGFGRKCRYCGAVATRTETRPRVMIVSAREAMFLRKNPEFIFHHVETVPVIDHLPDCAPPKATPNSWARNVP